MVQNLNIGTPIPSNEGGQLQTNNGIIEKYCYGNNPTYCSGYGGLYEWNEAMQYMTTEGAQGICPAGWHIPSEWDWKLLEGTVDSQYGVGDPEWDESEWRGFDAGGKVKEAGTTNWASPNEGATNASGFTALPGGYRDNEEGVFIMVYSYGGFWSSTGDETEYALYRVVGYDHSDVFSAYWYKDYGFSVRCLKDCSPQPSEANAGPDQMNIPGTYTTLAGNAPSSGTGLWAIVSGTGGTIVDPDSPTSEFQGQAGNEYTLSWTITTVCGISVDQVVISFATSSTGQPCPGTETVDYEGQIYNTVLIGTQCWLKENLNVGAMIESNSGGQLQTNNGYIEKYCYNNDPSNCAIYGGLYEWREAMQYVTTEGAQGICPSGWHIPTQNEFNTIRTFLGGEPVAGGKMKETGTEHWLPPNAGATNESGFTGLPGGYRWSFDGTFLVLRGDCYMWSSTQTYDPYESAFYGGLYFDDAYFYENYAFKEWGFAVRCLKNE
ncbi:MAG: hypothetical protein KBB71_00710 [Lentimicrobiaceae bacterium]|nr:hypothetical protein [Lentimicrobiaceae bacterium]